MSTQLFAQAVPEITPRYDAERRFVGYLMISHPVASQ